MSDITSNSCIVCLKIEHNGESTSFQDIHESNFDGLSALEVLNHMFCIKVDSMQSQKESSNIPQKICFYCSAKLAISMEVWNLALKAKSVLESLVSIQPQEDFIQIKDEDSEVELVGSAVLSNSDIYACVNENPDVVATYVEYHDRDSTFSGFNETHSMMSYPDANYTYEETPQRNFKFHSYVPKPQKAAESGQPSELQLSQLETRKRFKCSKCPMAFHLQRELNLHKTKHRNKRFHLCKICNRNFILRIHLEKHMLKQHPEVESDSLLTEPYKNPLPSSSNDSSPTLITKALKRNMNSEQKLPESNLIVNIPIQCDRCGQVAPNKRSAALHLLKYQKSGKCSMCYEEFSYGCQLKKHVIEQHSNFKCSMCNRSFLHQCQLNQHLQRHSLKGDYVCGICGMEFTKKTHVESHIFNGHKDAYGDLDL